MTQTVDLVFANTVDWRAEIPLVDGDAPLDSTGFEARMQLRAPAEASVAAATFSTGAGTLLVDGATLQIAVPRGITLGIPTGDYVYDVVLTDGATALRPVEGTLRVKQGITR